MKLNTVILTMLTLFGLFFISIVHGVVIDTKCSLSTFEPKYEGVFLTRKDKVTYPDTPLSLPGIVGAFLVYPMVKSGSLIRFKIHTEHDG